MRPKEGSLSYENDDVRTLRAFQSHLQVTAAACSAGSSRMINRKIQRSPHLTLEVSPGFVTHTSSRVGIRSVQKSVNIPKGSAPGLRADQTGTRA
jgi:hypothetical protein